MKLGSLFSDGAVLQQLQPVMIWGETVSSTLVRAFINGQSGVCRSSVSGEFMLQLPPMEAGGPFELEIAVENHPGENVVLHDIYIGEVWLCSGQSNMQYCLGHRNHVPPVEDGVMSVSRLQEKEFIDTCCPDNELRFLTVPKIITGSREKYINAVWRGMDSMSAPEASAAGAWFAAELHKEFNVPVGLICCSWGGSIVEAWTSAGALRSNPDTRELIGKWEALKRNEVTWRDNDAVKALQLKGIAEPDCGSNGIEKEFASPEFDDSAWGTMKVPGSWIDQQIAGNGAIWVRKKFTLEADYTHEDLQIELGGIDKHDIVYINGTEIGRTGKGFEDQYWEVPRSYTIPGKLLHVGENTIAIRVFSFAFDGSFRPPEEAYFIHGSNVNIPLAGDWKVFVEYDRGRVFLPRLMSITSHTTPTLLFDSMIRPLLPFTIRGVLWYQGESNANKLDEAYLYKRQMETLVRDWRNHWENPDLPFIQVQLADYRKECDYDEFSPWAVLRDCQGKVCKSSSGVFMATALATGEIEDIHPQNKKEIGHRLAVNALHHVYNKDVLPGGPCCIKAGAENGKLRLFFQYADGMYLQDAPGKSFYLAGADGIYHPAETAVIEENTLLLSSTLVKDPQKVRYAWADNPNNILYNREYPAAAFECQI